MRKYLLPVVLASILSPSLAFASASASASISDLKFQLMDLDPSDSVTPSYLVSGMSYVSLSPDFQNVYEEGVALGPLHAVASASLGNAWVSGDVSLSNMSVSGRANGLGTNFFGAVSATDSWGGAATILLSAHSLLKVSGVVAVSATVPQLGYFANDLARASAFFMLSYEPSFGSLYTAQVSKEVLSHPYYVSYPSDTNSDSQAFSFFVANLSDSVQYATFSMSAQISGSSGTTSAVPEPEALVLAAAGAALVGVIARRRRKV